MAINTNRYGSKRAFSINPHGGGYEQLDFEFGYDTEVDRSCSLQWKNQYYVFGGWALARQVSMVNGNKLERKGTLKFNLFRGTCTVLNQVTIVLCFDRDDEKVCRQSNNPLGSFTRLPDSKQGHLYIDIASFDGKSFKLIEHFKTKDFRYFHRCWKFKTSYLQ